MNFLNKTLISILFISTIIFHSHAQTWELGNIVEIKPLTEINDNGNTVYGLSGVEAKEISATIKRDVSDTHRWVADVTTKKSQIPREFKIGDEISFDLVASATGAWDNKYAYGATLLVRMITGVDRYGTSERYPTDIVEFRTNKNSSSPYYANNGAMANAGLIKNGYLISTISGKVAGITDNYKFIYLDFYHRIPGKLRYIFIKRDNNAPNGDNNENSTSSSTVNTSLTSLISGDCMPRLECSWYFDSGSKIHWENWDLKTKKLNGYYNSPNNTLTGYLTKNSQGQWEFNGEWGRKNAPSTKGEVKLTFTSADQFTGYYVSSRDGKQKPWPGRLITCD